jgi:hypothetical protein
MKLVCDDVAGSGGGSGFGATKFDLPRATKASQVKISIFAENRFRTKRVKRTDAAPAP